MRVGSSPLARGLPCCELRAQTYRRIIPARAGFTANNKTINLAPGDHPRSRGVYVPPKDVPAENRGSSPLARGLHTCPRCYRSPIGIIPARAGFTSLCR